MNTIKAEEIKFVDVEKIIPHEKNMNIHSKEQLDRLAEIIRYQGFRVPLIVSNLSGKLICGHARLEVAKKMGFKKVPVIFQDFEDTDQEYAAMVSENSIASWAELDLSLINLEIENLGPDFDIDLLGIKDFKLDPNFSPGTEDEQGKLDEKKMTKCPKCGEIFDHAKNQLED